MQSEKRLLLDEEGGVTYNISISENSTYIILEITGDITRQNAMQKNVKVHKFGREHGIKKYLVDLTNSRNKDTIINNYQFAYKDIQNTPDFDKTAIVAFVVAPEDNSHDFIETVARNNGLNITIFRDKGKAIEFLNSK
ncbi:MAG: hypothetical protein EHM47_07395 [Ignavibacteriales bacterium]|nr:MAG: hypothetical protein EHM47_07395 [Ignavibacteriales bacterium]